MHVMVAREHDVSAYFDPSAAVKRAAGHALFSRHSSFPSDDVQERRRNQA
jgi:hypothetical protein